MGAVAAASTEAAPVGGADPEIVAVPEESTIRLPPRPGSEDQDHGKDEGADAGLRGAEEEPEATQTLPHVQMELNLGIFDVAGSTDPLLRSGVPEAHGHL